MCQLRGFGCARAHCAAWALTAMAICVIQESRETGGQHWPGARPTLTDELCSTRPRTAGRCPAPPMCRQEDSRMQVKTRVKAWGLQLGNHNETLVRATPRQRSRG